jgi:hypothetical protein
MLSNTTTTNSERTFKYETEIKHELLNIMSTLVNEKITIVTQSEFGGINLQHILLEQVEASSFAQYDHAIKYQYKPYNMKTKRYKRNSYVNRLYSLTNKQFAIYKGFINIDTDCYKTSTYSDDFNCNITEYMSFDNNNFRKVISGNSKENLVYILDENKNK